MDKYQKQILENQATIMMALNEILLYTGLDKGHDVSTMYGKLSEKTDSTFILLSKEVQDV